MRLHVFVDFQHVEGVDLSVFVHVFLDGWVRSVEEDKVSQFVLYALDAIIYIHILDIYGGQLPVVISIYQTVVCIGVGCIGMNDMYVFVSIKSYIID